jgi:hypothetical protein
MAMTTNDKKLIKAVMNMDILSELKAAINEYNKIVSIDKNPYLDDVNERLESFMQRDEACTRRFLAECEPKDFEIACYGVIECAKKWKLPFIEYIEGLAEEKGWTDYSRRMVHYARHEVT